MRSGVSRPLASGGLMPDLGFYHPIVIHFAIGLLTGGVLLRGLSLTRQGAFADPAAVTLTLLVGGLELLTLALRGRPIIRTMSFVSAGLGLLAFLCVLQTGKLGGELV